MKRMMWILTVLVLSSHENAWAQTKIAVVNVPVVSERYLKTADLEAKFEGVRRSLSDQETSLRDRIERTRRSLQEELKPGTQEFSERRKQLAMLEAEHQWFVESEGKTIERDLASSLKLIFLDIQGTVRELAQERGIDIVLSADEVPPSEPETPTQMRQQIVLQKVLFWSPSVDLTDAVVERLNTKYNAEKAKDMNP